MKVIDQINGSALFAQSAYSASIATKDDLGRDITSTYLTAINIPESATWEDTSEVVKTNSGTWNTVTDKLDVTAQVISSCETSSIDDKTLVTKLNGNEIAVGYAGSAHVADIALKDYQGNSFIPFYAKTSALEEKLDTTAFSTVSGDFLTAHQSLSDYYTKDETSGKEELAQAFANIPGGDTEVGAYVHNNSASIDGTTSVVQSNSSTWNDVTAYQSNSATLNEVSTTVQTNSAQWAEGGSGDEEVNSFVYNNSATINEVNTAYQTHSASYQPSGNYIPYTSYDSINGYHTDKPLTVKGDLLDSTTIVADSLIILHSNDPLGRPLTHTTLSNYELNFSGRTGGSAQVDISSINKWNEVSTTVQSNSANWGNETISSYTTAWLSEIPPYGGEVINSLNGKSLSAFVSLSADNAKVATNANSATYAQTVDETKLKNDGFVKNLSSEYGTISVVHNNLIESTNSAISRVGNEGFVSSFQDKTIGPSVTANFSWNNSLPNTTFNFTEDYAPNNTIITYSANTNLTGEVTVTSFGKIPFSIDVPNATELNVWSNDWVRIKNNVASAADSFETVVGELAWASALPSYEYDITNKISAINGSAIAGGTDIEFGYTDADTISSINNSALTDVSLNNIVQTNSGAWGGGALPISAGPGIKVNLVDNTLVFSNDETVLWTQDGTFNGPGATLTFAEPASAFEKLEFKCGVDVQSKECVTLEYHPGNAVVSWHEYYDGKFRQFYSLLSVNDTGITAVSGCPYFANLVSGSTFTAYEPNWQGCFRAITAIHGINRIGG